MSPEQQAQLFAERVAIMTIDGELSEREAQRLAWQDVMEGDRGLKNKGISKPLMGVEGNFGQLRVA